MKKIIQRVSGILRVSCLVVLGGAYLLSGDAVARQQKGGVKNTSALSTPSSSTSKILLIVNKHPITQRDLTQRIKLLTLSSGGANADIGDSQKAEILESLIHESVQIQAAQKKKITVKDDEIMATIGEMGKENGMTAEKLLAFFKENDIDKQTLYNRVKAQLHWMKYVRQQFGALVHVSDSEVEGQLRKMDSDKGKKEYLISEIVLTVSDPKLESQTKESAEKLVRDIRGGAKFAALARDLSKAASSAKGGELGWMPASRLESGLSEKLGQMRIGQVSDPVKVSGGYKIIQLKDMRHAGQPTEDDMHVTMAQAIVPISSQPSEEELNRYGPIVDEIVGMSGCKNFLTKCKSHNIDAQENKGVRLGQIPDPLKGMVKTTPLGKTLQPIMTPDGLIVTMVCDRQQAKPVLVTKDDVSSGLEQQKYGSRAARELQRLMASAYIEVKDESIRKLIKI